MPYRSTKEIAQTVRESLKKELPGWKFSVRIDRGSWSGSISVSLVSGTEEVLNDGSGYAQLNHYYLETDHRLTPAGVEVMTKANEILAREHWDKSDAQIDHFYCAFYRHLAIGKWNRPYEVKGSK